MGSFNFNGINMGGYGVIVNKYPNALTRSITLTQVRNRSFNSGIIKNPSPLSLPVTITAASAGELLANLDVIRGILATDDDKKLVLDKYPDRYWMACLESIDEGVSTATSWVTVFNFVRADPLAFANTPVSSTHSIT